MPSAVQHPTLAEKAHQIIYIVCCKTYHLSLNGHRLSSLLQSRYDYLFKPPHKHVNTAGFFQCYQLLPSYFLSQTFIDSTSFPFFVACHHDTPQCSRYNRRPLLLCDLNLAQSCFRSVLVYKKTLKNQKSHQSHLNILAIFLPRPLVSLWCLWFSIFYWQYSLAFFLFYWCSSFILLNYWKGIKWNLQMDVKVKSKKTKKRSKLLSDWFYYRKFDWKNHSEQQVYFDNQIPF